MTGFYEGTFGGPTPIPHNIGEHVDVLLTEPAEANVLAYDAVEELWVNRPLILESLGNVDTTGVVDGNVLTFNEDSQAWVPAVPAGGGGGGSDDQTAAEVSFFPSGTIAATDVQGALQELDADIVALGAANTGDQTISLTGDVTGSGTGSFSATIANSAVSLAKMANVATGTIFYRKTSGAGVPEVQTIATLKSDLGLTGTNSGDQTLASLGLDSDLATFSVPASTTISTFGAGLVSDLTDALARKRLAVAVGRAIQHGSRPALFFVTGQSNVGSGNTGTDFPDNPNVYSLQMTTPAASPVVPALPSAANFTFQNVSASTAATAYVPIAGSPYIGYQNGGYGNVGIAAACRYQELYGGEVYVVIVQNNGANIALWEAGAGGYSRIVLETLMARVQALVPSLASVTVPDVLIWAQHESNYPDTATTYAGRLADVLDLAEGSWYSKDSTYLYLVEGTDAFKSGAVFGAATANWEGLRAFVRRSDDKVQLVSSTGLDYIVGDAIHFTGGGSNDYGVRIAETHAGMLDARSPFSTEIELDKNPVLGGDLDGDYNDISNLNSISFDNSASLTSLGNSRLALNGTYTYDYASARIPTTLDFYGTHIFEQNAGSTTATVVHARGTIKNATGETRTLTNAATVHAGLTFTADGAAVTQNSQSDFISLPSYTVTGGGTITVSAQHGFDSTVAVGTGATVTSRRAFVARESVLLGGTLTRQAGLNAEALAVASHNTLCLLGTATIPDGNWGIYQSGTLPNSLGGALTVTGALVGSSTLALTGAATLSSTLTMSAGSIILDSATSELKGRSISGANVGELVLHPNPANSTQTVKFTDYFDSMTMTYYPQVASSNVSLSIVNASTHVSGTKFIYNTGATMTGGQIMTIGHQGGTMVRFNWLGAPGFWGVTPVTTQATAGIGSSGNFVGGGGTGATSTSTWSGGTGTTAYTVNDLVRALKDIGILVL